MFIKLSKKKQDAILRVSYYSIIYNNNINYLNNGCFKQPNTPQRSHIYYIQSTYAPSSDNSKIFLLLKLVSEFSYELSNYITKLLNM